MKIAYLLHRFPGTTDTFIKREIRSLQKFGADVCVISTWQPKGREATPEIMAEWAGETQFLLPRSALSLLGIVLGEFLRAPGRFLSMLRLAVTLAAPGLKGAVYQVIYAMEAVLAAHALRQAKATHVHNHIGDHSGNATMMAARLLGIGYSITFHGWPVFFDAYNTRLKEKVQGAEFTRAISFFCRSQLMMFAGATDPTPFKVVHCGINPSKYNYRAPGPQLRRIFSAARLSPEKGQADILKAVRLLLDRGLDVTFDLAGDGPSRPALEELARELGLGSHVRFLGSISESEVTRNLQAADLFVLSSFVEGIPVSAMEAMATGVPVICTNIAGTSELVVDGETGLLTRPSDPAALADAAERLIKDPALAARLAEGGRRKVLEEFDVERETHKLYDAFLECSAVGEPLAARVS